MIIETDFDFQAEAGVTSSGVQRDSDRYSPTLQRYHKILWSKQLPSGTTFGLSSIDRNRLYHSSALGEFYLSSDWGAVTLSGRRQVQAYVHEIDRDKLRHFTKLVGTIGARIIWPANRIDGMSTINGARGMHYLIADRFDLTIECIRRYYSNQQSPLSLVFKRYENFFALFNDFQGYIDFFLLQDFVSKDYLVVHLAQPFDDFETSPIPKDVEEYNNYMETTKALIIARNNRIKNRYAE